MDWTSLLTILTPEWLIIAILLSVFGAFILRIFFDIFDIGVSGVLLFMIVIAVLLFLKIENIADPVGAIETYLKSAGVMAIWML